MNSLKNMSKQVVVLIVSEVLLLGLLSFGADKYIFKFMEDWSWWQYLLLLAGIAGIGLVLLILWDKLSERKSERRTKDLEREVGNFQLAFMQEFFKIQMTQAYGESWTDRVKTVVEGKFANNDTHKHNYQGIYDVLCNEGVETLDEKDMDITNITALMLYDFYNVCKVGSNFRQQVRNIQNDKNKLISHIPDPNDVLNVKILELTALKNIRSFLVYLSNASWSYAGKQEFIDKYTNQREEITEHVFSDVEGTDQKKVEFESTRVNYLNKLISEREANLGEYVPLAYKVDDKTAQRYTLEEIDRLASNEKGFVLFADAGYGKTWSIQELAGLCAKRAVEDDSGDQVTPILIKMGQIANNEEPLLKAVQEALFPGDDNLEEARMYVQTQRVVLYVDGMDEADKTNKSAACKEMIKLQDTCEKIRIIGGTRESDKQQFPANLMKYSICDLNDAQVKEFIRKLLVDKTKIDKAIYDYFENPKTNFLKNLRSPFYLKCYVDFLNEGEANPESDTDMMKRCVEKMIERELEIKKFNASKIIVKEFLHKMSECLGERRFVRETEALKFLRDELFYDTEEHASVPQIKDTLVELQILKEVLEEKQPALLGFCHEKYKELYSPTANDVGIWEY